MIPRWALAILALILVVWLLADPAGMADFFLLVGHSFVVFFQRLAS